MSELLTSLTLQPEYHKDTGDIASDFYLPCMRESIRYDRITGYFSSAVYIIAWPELRGFVRRGGRIRVLCSPVLTGGDIDGLELGYQARSDEELAMHLEREFRKLLADERLNRPARALACLVMADTVDLRVASVGAAAANDVKRLFHDKVGVFLDGAGHSVGFRGSMNETYLGLAADGNLESIDVFPSWEDGRDASRVVTASRRFEQLWNGEVEAVLVRDIPSATRDLLREASSQSDWELLIDEICAEIQTGARVEESGRYEGREVRVLRGHQGTFLDNWRANGMRGIAEHATGSGKTLTAVTASVGAVADGFAPVVVVPSELLLSAWKSELEEAGLKVLPCGGGSSSWRQGGLLRGWLRRCTPGDPHAVVAVVNSASEPGFISQIPSNKDVLLVADECHRLASPKFRAVLDIAAAARLGLSATPRRAGDPAGTAMLFDYFGGVVEPVYSLRDAIDDGVLTPYQYYPHRVSLTHEELEQWQTETAAIKRRVAMLGDGADGGKALQDDRLKQMLIRRARIVKKAEAKIRLAVDLAAAEFRRGEKWLVYCEDRDQLDGVRAGLKDAGVETLEYHSAMAGDRAGTLRDFEVNGGVLVSIKCLDEGVDIPAATHALILASSKNPREFVQRRGRVLRRHPGKTVAHLYDALVLPGTVAVEDDTDGLAYGELARALRFSQWAENPSSGAELERMCVDLGLDVDEIADLGVENEDNDG